jgi:hypothetical protein
MFLEPASVYWTNRPFMPFELSNRDNLSNR